MTRTTYFTTVDIALAGVFSALWATLSLTLGRLSFVWFQLPILCDFAAFLTLLLVTWATGKFGIASLVGILGSLIVLLFNPSPHIIGFAASAVLFDVLMLANRHRLNAEVRNMAIAALMTAIAAYFAGLVIGIFFMGKPLDGTTLQWALTVWGGWHLIGGVIGIVTALPIIVILEKAHVWKIKSAQ